MEVEVENVLVLARDRGRKGAASWEDRDCSNLGSAGRIESASEVGLEYE